VIFLSRLFVGTAAVLSALAAIPAPVFAGVVVGAGPAGAGSPAPGAYVVVLQNGADVSAVTRPLGIQTSFTYSSALTGFAATLTSSQVDALQRSPVVTAIEPDAVVHGADGHPVSASSSAGKPSGGSTTCTTPTTCQVIPTGIRYIHADQSPTAQIDGVDQRVDADVAVIDSGIDATHPDLNVVGGYSCVPGASAFQDGLGHGTGVSGVIGALDNGYGVVGVAPGVRLWSVRVIDDQGIGRFSSLLCGVDWVTRHASSIDAANMSLGRLINVNADVDDKNCGKGNPADALHEAMCALVAKGVTVAVAAGNESVDADYSLPAAYPEVLTISALTDFDGVPYTDKHDPHASPTCNGGAGETDDTFATYSDWGDDVDFIAPGTCIFTTSSSQSSVHACGSTTYVGYGCITGTSLAAPHVTGAVALIKSHDHSLTPDQVRAKLNATAITRFYSGDPDGIQEPTVDAGSL
jgi:subtilisin